MSERGALKCKGMVKCIDRVQLADLIDIERNGLTG